MSAAIFFWTGNAIFVQCKTIDLILCALSQRYNQASFLSWVVRKENQTSWRKAWPTKEETGAAKDCTWRKGIYGASEGAGICFD